MSPRGKRKKVLENVDVLDSSPESTVTETSTTSDFRPFQEMADSESKPRKERISFNLDNEGHLDVDSMRAETLSKVKEFFRDPENQKLLGTGVKIEEIVSEQDVAMLFDLIGTCEAWIFSLAGKIDQDIATKHAIWTDQQKALVVQPAQRVITKHSTQLSFLLKWKDEVLLAVIFLAISRAKYEGAKIEQKERNKERLDNVARSSGSSPFAGVVDGPTQ